MLDRRLFRRIRIRRRKGAALESVITLLILTIVVVTLIYNIQQGIDVRDRHRVKQDAENAAVLESEDSKETPSSDASSSLPTEQRDQISPRRQNSVFHRIISTVGPIAEVLFIALLVLWAGGVAIMAWQGHKEYRKIIEAEKSKKLESNSDNGTGTDDEKANASAKTETETNE